MKKKSILVFDSKENRREQHCKVLDKTGFVVWKWQDEDVVLHSAAKRSSKVLPEEWDLILLHAPSTDADKFSVKTIRGPVLHYSGDGSNGAKNWVPRPVNGDSPLSDRELKLFTKFFFSTSSATIEAAIDHVWSNAPILALRLLCESWKFVAEKKTAAGIVVNAPITPTDWFKPFGKQRPVTADAEEIAKLMGDVQVEAKKLLVAVLKNENIKKPIRDLLAKASQTKQAT